MDKESLQDSLSCFDRYDKYRVEKVLKQTSIETTEIVYQIAVDGSNFGPFIRKRFADLQQWNLYKRIMNAQLDGLREPGLPKIFEVGQDSSGYYSVLEFVKGESLRSSCNSALQAFEATCRAVQVLHEKFDPPIIHRDIKPDNVIVVPDGVVLIDFGAARSYNEDKDRDTHLYATRAYAPPEQFGYAQTDCRSDIYSLGMLLVFLLTGKDPDAEIKQAVMQGESALMAKGLDAAASRVVTKACAFDPQLRFASIEEMLSCLNEQDDAAGSLALTYPPPKNSERIVRSDAPQRGLVEGLRDKWRRGVFYKAGIAWDIALLAAWAFFMIVAMSMCFFPSDSNAPPTFLGRCLEYLGVSMTLISSCVVMVLDWRPIHSIGTLSKTRRLYIVVPLIVICVICISIYVLVFGRM